MTIRIPARQIALWVFTAVMVLLGFWFLWLIRNVVFLLFISILLATGIEPVVNFLRRGPFNRSSGILVVYTLIFAFLGLILYLSVPPLIDEGRNLVTNFTDPAKVRDAINNIDNSFFKGLAQTAYDSAGSILQNFHPDASTISVGLSVFEVIFSSLTVFVIAFYWMTERSSIKRFILSFVPRDSRDRANTAWQSVEEKLGAWVRGQLILMLFIGVLAGIGYTVMGLKFALALAFFAGLAELIPLVGPYIGGAPAVLIALTQSPTLAIIVVVYIVVLQLVEGNLLVPRIMERAVGVTPLTVILGILIGSTLAGIGGALVAVPLAAALQVLFNNILSFGSETTPPTVAVNASKNTERALQAAATARDAHHSDDDDE